MPTALQKAIMFRISPLPQEKEQENTAKFFLLNAHPGRRVGYFFLEVCMTHNKQVYLTGVLFRKIHLTNV